MYTCTCESSEEMADSGSCDGGTGTGDAELVEGSSRVQSWCESSEEMADSGSCDGGTGDAELVEGSSRGRRRLLL
jgi:hypothetical protein